MFAKPRIFLSAVLCLVVLCLGAGQVVTSMAVNWALKNEARSLGLDWASHIATRIPQLNSMYDKSGHLDPTKLPDPEEFRRLLSDITEVGHIYQFDFINAFCHCELSIGSYSSGPEDTTLFVEDHSGHDHPNLAVLDHIIGESEVHASQKLPANSGFQLPIDRQLARQVIKTFAPSTVIRSDFNLHQPDTFAEVYHPVIKDNEVIYLLRVLVDLDDQANTYTTFFRLGSLLGLMLLAISLGSPAFWYVKSHRKQREADQRAHFLAHHDVLTNLHNRNDFHETVPDILQQCRDRNESALLFLFDLNSFKEVNDYHGHQAGDQLLCQFAEVLKDRVPEGGYIARLGGDEFVMVVSGISESDPHHQTYLNMPAAVQLLVPNSDLVIQTSISGGVAHFPHDAEDIGELMQAADLALYAAKPNRMGEIREYNIHMKRGFLSRLKIRNQFRFGLSQSQIEPYYQPIIDMKTGKVQGFEALARWNHPELGVLTPNDFGTIFEETELSVLLGQQMLAKVTADMGKWKDANVPFEQICLNVLDSDLKQDGFVDSIFSTLDDNGLLSSELTIEVTENCLFGDNKAQLIAVLDRLSVAGHGISMDDFGTGYSSITQLKELPISSVKIDKSFVDDVINNFADQSIISALLDLGRSMGFKLILEGIETIDQRDFLRQMGFTLAQGYYYSAPIKASQVPVFCQQNHFGRSAMQCVAKSA